MESPYLSWLGLVIRSCWIALLLCSGTLLLWAARLMGSWRVWLLRISFAAGAASVVALAFVCSVTMRATGGLGIDSRAWPIAGFLAMETGILGYLSFSSPVRFVPLIFAVLGLGLLFHR